MPLGQNNSNLSDFKTLFKGTDKIYTSPSFQREYVWHKSSKNVIPINDFKPS